MQPDSFENQIGLYIPKSGMTFENLATPCLVVDIDTMEANIARLMSEFRQTNVTIRPHLKTAKNPQIAKKLLDAGAKGICVTKVGELEVMLEGGIKDILVTSPIAHSVTAAWAASLIERSDGIKFVVDSKESADLISRALPTGVNANVLLDINVGQDRTGVQPGQPAVELAAYVSGLPNVSIIGCQGYEGHLQMLKDLEQKEQKVRDAMRKLVDTAAALRNVGHKINTVTTGGTGTSLICASVDGITEIQPGSFVFMDRTYRDAIGSSRFGNALHVLATVISKPLEGIATVDAGWKSLSTEYGMPEVANVNAQYEPAGDEHGTLKGDDVANLRIGDRLKIVPSHIDTTIACHRMIFGFRESTLETVWNVASGGRVQ